MHISVNLTSSLVVVVTLIHWLCAAMKFEEFDQGHVYLTLYNIAAVDCRETCDERVKCTGTYYIHQRKACYLLDESMTAITSVVSSSPTKMAVYKKPTPTPTCGGQMCTGRQVCQNATCQLQECENVFLSPGYDVIGNKAEFGNRVKAKCKDGYTQTGVTMATTNHTTHVCDDNGQWDPVIEQCLPVTCMTIGQWTNESAEYISFDEGSGKPVRIWCDFKGDHGYVYIKKESIGDVTDISRFFTRTDHVMIRHMRVNNLQYIGKMQLLQQYISEGNITVLANDYNGFQPPANISQNAPYIYLHLLPEPFEPPTPSDVSQGYNFNGTDASFSNINAANEETLRNYFVVHTGVGNIGNELNCNSGGFGFPHDVTCMWYEGAEMLTTSNDIVADYLLPYSMRIGGGGTFFHKLSEVKSVAFGFRFDL